ncbi:hypothetical protein BDW74DRAFT_173719 [Aspergillus multicolor]|uniref:uncharacterized protein n=1 Tax=Aspergillus multicolor TaxID=41759 RepID=UPI003CCC8F61
MDTTSGYFLGEHPLANRINVHVERRGYKGEARRWLRLSIVFRDYIGKAMSPPHTDHATLEEVLTKHSSSSRTPSVTVTTTEITNLTECLEKTQLQDGPSTKLVSTPTEVADMLKSLEDLPSSPPSLYIELEGVNLSRHGTISILQIYSSASGPGGETTTLKRILGSPSIPRLIFDVRDDSDALYAHFKIHLAGIQDLQLLELATREVSPKTSLWAGEVH